jgi:hypothetical protein
MTIVHYLQQHRLACPQTRFLRVTFSTFRLVYVDVFPVFSKSPGLRHIISIISVPQNTSHTRYEHHPLNFWGRETICSIVEEGSDRTVTCTTHDPILVLRLLCTDCTKSLDFFEARHQWVVLVFLPQNGYDVLYICWDSTSKPNIRQSK